MKVWVIEECSYDGDLLRGVYATWELVLADYPESARHKWKEWVPGTLYLERTRLSYRASHEEVHGA